MQISHFQDLLKLLHLWEQSMIFKENIVLLFIFRKLDINDSFLWI